MTQVLDRKKISESLLTAIEGRGLRLRRLRVNQMSQEAFEQYVHALSQTYERLFLRQLGSARL